MGNVETPWKTKPKGDIMGTKRTEICYDIKQFG